jgi:malonyl-CoA O-methyltransferase
MSNAVNEFSRFAHQYNQYNVIQKQVAKELIKGLWGQKYQTVIDIGCGSGAVYSNMNKYNVHYDKLIALDSSKEMLSLHPNGNKIEKIHADFNQKETYQKFHFKKDEVTLFSSSSLQWSNDLDFVFSHLASIANRAYFAIFTSATFYTLHKTAGIKSPIYSKDELKEVIDRYYDAVLIRKLYRLEFQSAGEMFRYIKKSGVSGGKKQLGYRQAKYLMQNYPLNYLEFEVVFVDATSLNNN